MKSKDNNTADASLLSKSSTGRSIVPKLNLSGTSLSLPDVQTKALSSRTLMASLRNKMSDVCKKYWRELQVGFRMADRGRTGFVPQHIFSSLLAEYDVDLTPMELKYIALTMKPVLSKSMRRTRSASTLKRPTSAISSLASSRKSMIHKGICYSEVLKTFIVQQRGKEDAPSD